VTIRKIIKKRAQPKRIEKIKECGCHDGSAYEQITDDDDKIIQNIIKIQAD